MSSFYDLSAPLPNGSTLDFSSLKGKVVVVVNVASACGKTPQYKVLQQLYEKYQGQGLEIVGFPSNQFKAQEPGTDEEIALFCEKNYGVTFPLAKKSDVNGPDANAVYKFLKGAKGVDAISWNFDAFLVDKDGNVVKHRDRTSSIDDLEDDLKKLL